jgi:hypothetical protein
MSAGLTPNQFQIRPVRVQEAARGIAHVRHRRRVVHEGLEARLAGAQRVFGTARFGAVENGADDGGAALERRAGAVNFERQARSVAMQAANFVANAVDLGCQSLAQVLAHRGVVFGSHEIQSRSSRRLPSTV